MHLDDLKLYKQSPQGFAYYNSDSLQKCWSDPDTGEPYGFAVVAEVTWETCAYTARYVMKKLTGKEAEFYSNFNIQPEFTLMSRKPESPGSIMMNILIFISMISSMLKLIKVVKNFAPAVF